MASLGVSPVTLGATSSATVLQLVGTGYSLVSDLCNIVLTKPYFQENFDFLYFSGS